MRHAQPERADRDVEVEADAGRRGDRRVDLAGQRGGAPPVRQPGLGDGQHHDGDTQRERGRRLGGRDAGGGKLHVGEHGQREGVVGEQHGRAVLADRAQPGQQQPGADAGGGDPYPDQPEAGRGAVPEARREVVERRVDAGERGPRRDDQERAGDERLRDDHAGHGLGEAAVEQLAEEGVGADQVDQHEAAHHRRPREGQQDAYAGRPGAGDMRTGHPERHRGADQRHQGRGDGGALDRVQQRRPQARGLEAAVAWLSEPDDEGDYRDGQVQRQQPAQPGERAAGRSISHH
jgi:hypothetical protein